MEMFTRSRTAQSKGNVVVCQEGVTDREAYNVRETVEKSLWSCKCVWEMCRSNVCFVSTLGSVDCQWSNKMRDMEEGYTDRQMRGKK